MAAEDVLRTSAAQLPLRPDETRTRATPLDGYGAQPDRSVSNPPFVTKVVEPLGSVVEVVDVVVVVGGSVVDVVDVIAVEVVEVVDVVVEVVVVDGWNSSAPRSSNLRGPAPVLG